MIRQVELQDAKAITNIYNEYVLHSVATFDTEPVQEEEMRARTCRNNLPAFLISSTKKTKKYTGYCYCPYVERAFSLPLYAGNNCLPVSRTDTGKGRSGVLLDAKID